MEGGRGRVFTAECGSIVVIALYVDDGAISGPEWLVDALLAPLGQYFALKIQSGDRLQLLGMCIEVHRRSDRLLVAFTMEDYLAKLYTDFCKESGRQRFRSSATP